MMSGSTTVGSVMAHSLAVLSAHLTTTDHVSAAVNHIMWMAFTSRGGEQQYLLVVARRPIQRSNRACVQGFDVKNKSQSTIAIVTTRLCGQ
jgi:hypothetical protein